MTKIIICTLLSSIVSFASYCQLIKDESYLDSDFSIFKAELTLAIKKKDTSLLSSLMADTVYGVKDNCGINGCSKKQFFEYSFDSNSNNQWEELAKIVRFGFIKKNKKEPYDTNSKMETVFQAPSYLDDFDYEKKVAILGDNVNIRKNPNKKSEIISKVSYELASCKCGTSNMTKESYVQSDGIRWIYITLQNGLVGYVAEKLTSNSISTEITVKKINGKWKITSISPTMFC